MKRFIPMLLLQVVIGTMLVHCAGAPKIPDLNNILEREPPISTSLSDATTGIPFLDDFNPKTLMPVTLLSMDQDNNFLLIPGLWEFNAQSYCLNAGKYVPGAGDGYLYAPLKGLSADIVRNILQRSVDHPEVSQSNIQALLWAILVRTKISEMSGEMQLTAKKLLSPEEIFELNGGALGLIPEALYEKVFAMLPQEVRQVMEVEARLRSMLTEAKITYEELERVAVLRGDPPPEKGDREVPLGRWSYHPDGYFIRYFPQHYSETKVQIYVPEPFKIEKDTLGRIISISDLLDNRIEVQYDDSIEPIHIEGEPGLMGYAFRSVRFEYLDLKNVDERIRGEWKNVGWTLIGIHSGESKTRSHSPRFPDLAWRYKWYKKHKEELDHVEVGIKKMLANKQPPLNLFPSGHMDTIISLANLAVAIKDIIAEDFSEMEDWYENPLYMLKKAWQNEVYKREGGFFMPFGTIGLLHQSGTGLNDSSVAQLSSLNPTIHLNPGGGQHKLRPSTAQPGKNGRQREEVSNREKKEKKTEEIIEKIKKECLDEAKKWVSSCRDRAKKQFKACNDAHRILWKNEVPNALEMWQKCLEDVHSARDECLSKTRKNYENCIIKTAREMKEK